MADTKISALTALLGANADGAEEIALNDAGTSKKMTLFELEEWLETRGLPRTKRLGSTHTCTTIAPTAVTGLDMPLVVATHWFDYRLIIRSATGGVAPTFNLNFTGTGAPVWWFQYADLSATLLAAIGQVANNVTTPTLGFQMAQAENVEATTATGNMGPLGGLQATGQDHMVQISGIVVASGAGDLQLWHGSETATSTTVEVGSSLVTHQVS